MPAGGALRISNFEGEQDPYTVVVAVNDFRLNELEEDPRIPFETGKIIESCLDCSAVEAAHGRAKAWSSSRDRHGLLIPSGRGVYFEAVVVVKQETGDLSLTVKVLRSVTPKFNYS